MALPLFNRQVKIRDRVIAIDLGGRTTKAVDVQRKGESLVLTRYVLLDAPIYEKNLSVDLLSEHLKAVCQALETKTRLVSIAISVADSIVRHAELPQMRIEDMRQILKNNTKMYLQQDLPAHAFDCFVIPTRQPVLQPGEKAKAGASPKQKVLVAGAKRMLLDDLQAATRNVGLIADHVVPGLIGPVNAFELALPELFNKEIVALVDMGFKNSTICLLQEGELILSRVLAIGGDKLTNGLAEAMNVSYAEAEGIKLGMPAEVQDHLQMLVSPLGRELKASIDFFEHQQDRPVTQVFVSGGSARSELIVQMLQAELMAECKTWNPTGFMQHALPPQQVAELEQVSPQLTVAVGAAVATL
jgi:type IV pilus assembly protein PilM